MQQYLSDFINLIFPPEKQEDEKLHSWTIIILFFGFMFMIFVLLMVLPFS